MPGPVFFVQKRVGRYGELFSCHKFRTMKVGHCGSTISVAGESRITTFGAKLRKYKLDEIPELWDVFIGKMSFVGPRPDVPGYADMLHGENRDILTLRPGITGPASLKYRNEEEIIANFISTVKENHKKSISYKGIDFNNMTDEEIAVWYNDNIIYPDKVRLNLYYLRHYKFIDDIKIILATIFGKKINYAGETI